MRRDTVATPMDTLKKDIEEILTVHQIRPVSPFAVQLLAEMIATVKGGNRENLIADYVHKHFPNASSRKIAQQICAKL